MGNFLEDLIKKRGKYEFYTSKQYQLSKKILYYKHENDLTVEEMAEKLGLDLVTYLEYESGYRKYTEREYNILLEKLGVVINE